MRQTLKVISNGYLLIKYAYLINKEASIGIPLAVVTANKCILQPGPDLTVNYKRYCDSRQFARRDLQV